MTKKKTPVELPPFEYPQGYLAVAGVDEVGRGPLVGDVVTAAVILDPNNPIEGLNDSKKLSEKKRLALYPEIKEKALAWSVGRCSPEEIDQLNILQATMVAMQRAVAGLSATPDLVLIDGNRTPALPMDAQAVVKGDLRVAEISAALSSPRWCVTKKWKSSIKSIRSLDLLSTKDTRPRRTLKRLSSMALLLSIEKALSQ